MKPYEISTQGAWINMQKLIIRADDVGYTDVCNIGTFETSILPYEDCCTVFTPRHPKTRPSMEEILAAEANLDIDGLIQRAVDGIERVTMG